MSTNIEWTNETINPIVGCSRISPGCEKCYAATAAASPRLQQFPQYQAVKHWDGTVQFVESQLTKPLHWRKPKKIFVCSMSDLFHKNVSFEWIDRVMAVIALSPQHTFQVLTKRPCIALEYFSQPKLWVSWYEAAKNHLWGTVGEKFGGLINLQQYFTGQTFPLKNLWLGTSTENQAMADKRIPVLMKIPATVRFLSCEPLLEEIDLKLFNHSPNWIIVGGESGPNSRPCHLEWIESIVNQCKSANVRVFVKQLGANAYFQQQPFRTRDRKGGDITEFPEHLQIRQFPNFTCD